MSHYSIENFRNALDQPCTLRAGENRAYSLRLLEVINLMESGDSQSQQFSVIWRGPATPLFPQRIYRIEMRSGELYDLFLVPIGKDKQGNLYEAVFT